MTARAENSGKLWTSQEDDGCESLLFRAPIPPKLPRSSIEPKQPPRARAYVLRLARGGLRARRRDLSKWGLKAKGK